jgi:hypothetical protein
MLNAMAGSGSLGARLSGTTLSYTGRYGGLKGFVTSVELRSARPGLRGPVVATLRSEGANDGTIAGEVQLTSQQVEQLRSSRLYVQLNSKAAPDGNLWGWLFPEEK